MRVTSTAVKRKLLPDIITKAVEGCLLLEAEDGRRLAEAADQTGLVEMRRVGQELFATEQGLVIATFDKA